MPVIYRPSGAALEYAPLAANLFRGCGHGCVYCYAPAALRMSRGDFVGAVRVRDGVLEALDRDAARLSATGNRGPVLLCFTTDAFQASGQYMDVSLEAIRILKRHGMAVSLLSKGGLAALPALGLMGEGDAFGVTLTTPDETARREWEPGAAPAEDRIAALREVWARPGVLTWASFEPVLRPEWTLNLIGRAAPILDLAWVGRWNHDPRSREIDWLTFARWARALLGELGVAYKLKAALRAECEAAGTSYGMDAQ